jgi:phytoene desaturase
MSRVVVIGAGLGGLAVALRLQGTGHEVIVVEALDRPGGRAGQLRRDGFTWDTGPSLVTIPWVLEETFTAGGLDLSREITLRRLEPFYRIFWDGESEHLDFFSDPHAMKQEIAKFSSRDATAFDGFMDALRPIYTEGILAAGRRPFLRATDLARFTPKMVSLGAAQSVWRLVGRHFQHPRIREAFSFHSLYIGGDPFRVPAIYAALVYLQFNDGVWYADGGVYSIVEAMSGPLDIRYGARAERIEHRAGAVSGVRLAGGERIAADVVISNADVMRTHELTGRRPPLRRLRPTMSAFLLYLGTDRVFDTLTHHSLTVGQGYREFITDVTRRGRMPTTQSTYIHAPVRTEPGMAPPGGDSLAVLLPVPNLRSGIDWTQESQRRRDQVIEDLEQTYGLSGLAASIVSEHRMTPRDFESTLGAAWGNAFSAEPTLHQSAYLRQPNRDRALRGLYHVGGGTHPGAGIPGVLLGAEITAGLVNADVDSPLDARRWAHA